MILLRAGGDYRYVITKNTGRPNKIKQVTLMDRALHRVPDGWSGMSIDINKGRGGRFLHLVWKTIKSKCALHARNESFSLGMSFCTVLQGK